jgi:hypothetical protein
MIRNDFKPFMIVIDVLNICFCSRAALLPLLCYSSFASIDRLLFPELKAKVENRGEEGGYKSSAPKDQVKAVHVCLCVFVGNVTEREKHKG